MSIAAGVVVTLTFQQVDGPPHAETSTQSDNQSLKNFDSRVKAVSYTHLDVYKRQIQILDGVQRMGFQIVHRPFDFLKVPNSAFQFCLALSLIHI